MCIDIDAARFAKNVGIPGRSVEAFHKSLMRKRSESLRRPEGSAPGVLAYLVQVESENRAI